MTVTLLICGNSRPVFAQDEASRIRDLLTKAQEAYSRTPYLSFRVNYLYSNEGQPGHPMDSLSGEVEMDKGRWRFVIDGTETVITDKYSLQIMRDTRSIYLAAAKHKETANPINMLDSVFAHIDGVKAHLGKEDHQDIVTLEFPPGQTYSTIRIRLDEKTGYFQRISYSLFTEALVGQDMVDRPGHPAPYQAKGEVDIVFSRYEHGRFGDGLFQEQNYFQKTAGRIEPAGQYKDYHIFLANSNL